jgi:hypothetical protein
LEHRELITGEVETGALIQRQRSAVVALRVNRQMVSSAVVKVLLQVLHQGMADAFALQVGQHRQTRQVAFMPVEVLIWYPTISSLMRNTVEYAACPSERCMVSCEMRHTG